MITRTCGDRHVKAGAIEMATSIVGEVRKNNGRLASYLK
jgi:hypothetical protein